MLLFFLEWRSQMSVEKQLTRRENLYTPQLKAPWRRVPNPEPSCCEATALTSWFRNSFKFSGYVLDRCAGLVFAGMGWGPTDFPSLLWLLSWINSAPRAAVEHDTLQKLINGRAIKNETPFAVDVTGLPTVCLRSFLWTPRAGATQLEFFCKSGCSTFSERGTSLLMGFLSVRGGSLPF